MAGCASRGIWFSWECCAHCHSVRELDKMCSKYNRLLLSTCISIFAFGTFTNNPAHAEFKWTPPDEPDYVEDAGPDVFIVDDEAMSSDVALDSALPEYYDIRLEEIVFEDDPPIEVKILEQDTDRDGEKSVEIKTINFSDKKEEAVETEAPQNKVGSLVLDPYPLKDDGSVKDDGSASEEEDRQVDVQMHSPPVSVGVSYEVIEGFGMKIPLALALSQRLVWLFGSLPGVVIHLIGAHLPKDFFLDYDDAIN